MSGGRDYNPPPSFYSPPKPFNHQIHSKENVDAWLKSVNIKQLDVAKGLKSQMAWLSSSESKQRADAAKAQAISEFKKQLPRADISKFHVEVDFDSNRKATASVLFKESDGSQTDPLIKDHKYWSQPLKHALGMDQDGGFPFQLSLFIANKPQPVPAVDFSNNITHKEMKIYVTPTDYFTTKFRQIFTKAKIKFTTSKNARKWLAKPDMTFWQKQLNFALWCATTGCGVSREILSLPALILVSKFAHQFHVYYTTRKILYEIGGIQIKQNLVLTQGLISALHVGKITDSVMYT